jgi:hypothetical protein
VPDATPSVISEKAFRLALRTRAADLGGTGAVRVARAAIPEHLESAPDPADAWIYGAYAVVLSRTPDREGLAGFRHALAVGVPPATVLQQLRRSPEGRAARAELPADHRDVFVVGCHLTVLGRTPTGVELRQARAALDAGESTDAYLTRLMDGEEARDLLRFPPRVPDRFEALAVAVQRCAGAQEDAATTSRLRAELAAGAPTATVASRWMSGRVRNPLGRIRLRLVLPLLLAQVEAVAAADLARSQARTTQDLLWRLEAVDADERSITELRRSRRWAQWYS